MSTSHDNCIFCNITKGSEPEHVVFANEHAVAFLDINPLVDSKAHVLVIPREHYPTVDVMTDEAAAEVGRVLPKIARAVLKATGGTSFNIVQNNGASAGQVVFHVHFHIVVRDVESPRSKYISDIVEKVKHMVGLKESMYFGFQVFGRGQREDLDESDLVDKIRENVSKL